MNKTFYFQYYNASSHSVEDTLETARKWNIFATIPVILIGIFGHSLTILVFSQKRFRTNSNNVLVLCLAINDSLYLLNHLFEDTLRTYRDIFIKDDNSSIANLFILKLNITDKHRFSCPIVHYLKYSLRFVSAYILVTITLQRLLIVYKPMSQRFKSKKFAWLVVLSIVIVSLLVNSWVPFVFELRSDTDSLYCDVAEKYSTQYFQIEAMSMISTILIPILIILTANLFIMINLCKANQRRKNLNTFEPKGSGRLSNTIVTTKSHLQTEKRLNIIEQSNEYIKVDSLSTCQRLKPFYLNANTYANRPKHPAKCSPQILLLITSLFLLFNMPYFINWVIIFQKVYKLNHNFASQNTLFAALQISEIVYNLNFTLLFYVYCLTGAKFRFQLRHLSMNFFFDNILVYVFYFKLHRTIKQIVECNNSISFCLNFWDDV